MNKFFLLLILFLRLTGQSLAQEKESILDGVYLPSDEEQILEIESIKTSIDKEMPLYKKVEKARDSLGYRNAYFDGKELKLVVVFSKENKIDKTASWYFHKGKLVYAQSGYSGNGSGSLTDEKLYLENEHLFWWTIGGKPVDRNSVNFKKSANELGYFALKLKMENTE